MKDVGGWREEGGRMEGGLLVATTTKTEGEWIGELIIAIACLYSPF